MVDTPKESNSDEATEDNPSRSNLSTDVSGAVLSPTIAKIAIPAQETIALRMMPKTKTIAPSQASSKPDGRMGK